MPEAFGHADVGRAENQFADLPRQWFGELKIRFRKIQLKAAVAVNTAMRQLYCKLMDMVAKQTQFGADSAVSFVLAWCRNWAAACFASLDHPLEPKPGHSEQVQNLFVRRLSHLDLLSGVRATSNWKLIYV